MIGKGIPLVAGFVLGGFIVGANRFFLDPYGFYWAGKTFGNVWGALSFGDLIAGYLLAIFHVLLFFEFKKRVTK